MIIPAMNSADISAVPDGEKAIFPYIGRWNGSGMRFISSDGLLGDRPLIVVGS